MASFASRFLSRSKQVHGSLVILQKLPIVPARSFAKEAPRPTFKGDEMLKEVFMDIKTKFNGAMDIVRKEKIVIDPEDPVAVRQYANVMKKIRDAGYGYSESDRIQYEIDTEAEPILDARGYLMKLTELREGRDLTDDLGIEAMRFAALDKVEKQIKKPLMRNDHKGMELLLAEFDKIYKKLGIRIEDLPKYDEELDLCIAKAMLEELKNDMTEAMEAQLKKEEFKDEQMPDIKSLDIRNFL